VCDAAGTDIVSVARIARLLRDHGDVFLNRWFTPTEIDYCTAKAEPSRHLAARFAAKESVVKALPAPWVGPLPWRSIEIVNGPHGAPGVRLHGAFGEAATRAGVRRVRVSLSHCDEYATAIALLDLSTLDLSTRDLSMRDHAQDGGA
jgi:holo-[acyl-carrier protein] synthase